MTESKIKVAVAEDQKMFRDGFVSLLNVIGNLEVVIEADNGKELIDALAVQKVDLVFVDFRMPKMNGISAVKIMHKKYPDTKILMLSGYSNNEFVEVAMKNGAHGYLSKDDDPEEIYAAIHSVLSTGYYLNSRASSYPLNLPITSKLIKPKLPKPVDKDELTELEIVVIRMIAKQMSTKEIADKIFRSVRTVESIRTSIMEKTGAKNSIGIILFAAREKIIEF